MISSTIDLSVYLLGNHQLKRDDENDLECDEEEGCMPSCSPKILYDELEEDYSQSSSSDKNEHHYLLSLFILHVLLFETFGVALYASHIWLDVNCSIILFVIISFIYKQAIKDCCYKPTRSTVFFLPELLQIKMLSLVIFDKVDAALLLLLISILCLAFWVAAIVHSEPRCYVPVNLL